MTTAILFVLVIILGCSTVFFFMQFLEVRRLRKKSEAEFESNLQKYSGIIDLEGKEAELAAELQRKEVSVRDLRSSYSEKMEHMRSLEAKLQLLQSEDEMLDFGVYTPQFELDDSEKYKIAIKSNKAAQKETIRDKTACSCTEEWHVGGSKSEGKKMIDKQIRLMLRAFNGECDSIIAKVKWNNVTRMEERIKKAYEVINKQGEINKTSLSHKFLLLKLEELALTHEKNLKTHEEKEEQREIRELMREEARVQKEFERAQRAAEKEEATRRAALEQARAELAQATDAERDALNERLRSLEEALADAHSQTERVMSQAQLTRCGYVYIISNIGSFGEGMFKIGMTRRLEPMDRVRELGDASVPFTFDVHALIYSEDAPKLEKSLHQMFDEKRVNLVNYRKEFFQVSLADIEAGVSSSGYEIEFTRVAEAQDYRETLNLRSKLAPPEIPVKFPHATSLPDSI